MRSHNTKTAIAIALTLFILAAVSAAFFLLRPARRLSGKIYKTGYAAAIGGGTQYDGVELSFVAMNTDAEPKVLTVTWYNGSDEAITYGEAFHIYKSEDGEWVSCSNEKQSMAFDDIAYFLSPGIRNVKSYRNEGFDLLRIGTYRIEAFFFLNRDVPVSEENRLKVWLDFVIKEKPPEAA